MKLLLVIKGSWLRILFQSCVFFVAKYMIIHGRDDLTSWVRAFDVMVVDFIVRWWREIFNPVSLTLITKRALFTTAISLFTPTHGNSVIHSLLFNDGIFVFVEDAFNVCNGK